MDTIRLQREILDINPEAVFSIGNFPVANSFLLGVLIVLVIAFGLLVIKRFALVPTGWFQNMAEYLYEGMVGLVDQVTGSREGTKVIFPLIGALFVYIGFANLIGFIPGLTSITWGGTDLFRIPTTDFNVTFGLALSMLVFVQLVSIKDYGLLGYIGKFIKVKELVQSFKHGGSAIFTAVIEFFIGLLDIISEIAKVVSLSVRLFGNLYAGEALAVVILGAFAYILPAVWMGASMLFGLIQTLVFALLVTAYYQLARKPESEQGA